MMVSQNITTNQLESLSRQQRRELERDYQKKLNSLQRRTNKCNLPISFDNLTVTAFGNFGILEAFKQAIDFRSMLSRIRLKRHHNCKLSPELANWFMPDYTAEMWPAMVSLWNSSKKPWTL